MFEMNNPIKLGKRLFIFLYLSSVALISVLNYASLNEMQPYPASILNYILSPVKTTVKSPKIYCLILTTEKQLPNRAKIVYDAWGHLCSNHSFIAVLSTLNKTGNEAISVKFNNSFNVLQPEYYTKDSYGNLTTKMFRTLINMYQANPSYDWYLKADDDTFIFYENLQNFLKDKDPESPVTYGYNMKIIVDKGFHSGGGGYVLSREALHRIGKQLIANFTFCPNCGIEDTDVANCLRQVGVFPGNSTDAKGRERFHSMDLKSSYERTPNMDWLYTYARNPPKQGLECCSDTSISFHKPHEDIQIYSQILKKTHGSMTNFKNFVELYYEYRNLSKPIFTTAMTTSTTTTTTTMITKTRTTMTSGITATRTTKTKTKSSHTTARTTTLATAKTSGIAATTTATKLYKMLLVSKSLPKKRKGMKKYKHQYKNQKINKTGPKTKAISDQI